MKELSEELLKSESGKKSEPIKIFLASPSDVGAYRSATIQIVDEFNEPFKNRTRYDRFHCWAWEISKIPGLFEDYQQSVFEEFGKWCDVFILILWHKIGQGGTEAEYQEFVEVFRKENPNIRFLVAHSNEKIAPSNIDTIQLNLLRDFVDANQDDWAPLGNVRGSIENVEDYKKLLRQELAFILGQ